MGRIPRLQTLHRGLRASVSKPPVRRGRSRDLLRTCRVDLSDPTQLCDGHCARGLRDRASSARVRRVRAADAGHECSDGLDVAAVAAAELNPSEESLDMSLHYRSLTGIKLPTRLDAARSGVYTRGRRRRV